MTVQTTFTTALSSIPLPLLPRGSSLTNSTRFVVQAVAVALLATVVSSTVSAEVRTQQEQAQIAAAADPQAGAQHFGVCETPGVAPEENIPPAAAAQLQTMPAANAAQAKAQILAGVQQACVENIAGFECAYRLTFYFAIIALILGALLPGWPLKWGGRGSMQSTDPQSRPAPAH